MYMYSMKGGCLVSDKADELVYVRINWVCGTSAASAQDCIMSKLGHKLPDDIKGSCLSRLDPVND